MRLSLEHRRKLKEARISFLDSPEGGAWKKAQSLRYLGRQLSNEIKERVSKTCKRNGVGKWMKGRKIPIQVTKKIALQLKGRPRPDSVRRKISEAKKGEKAYNWKGGITKVRTKLYFTQIHKNWRKSVFERDNYTCVLCGKRGGVLAADHIHPFALLLYEAKSQVGDSLFEKCMNYKPIWDINNGRTLCYPCHYKTPNFGGKAIKLYVK